MLTTSWKYTIVVLYISHEEYVLHNFTMYKSKLELGNGCVPVV